MAFTYTVVPGLFVPSETETDPAPWEYINSSYGIIHRSYPSDTDADQSLPHWTRLQKYIQHLRQTAPSKTEYKLLFVARHGEGEHNLGETKYSTKAWNEHWARLDGDGELHWSDAHLTKRGEAQAIAGGSELWSKAAERGLPWPQTYYVSPLARCLQTSTFTFASLSNRPEDQAPFKPIVKEMLRETIGIHTCDRRSSLTALHKTFPKEMMDRFTFEPGFSEEDKLWRPDVREQHSDTQRRVRLFLDDLFEHDDSTIISITSHSGWIKAALVVIGHRVFPLDQGSAIAVLVKAVKQ